MKELSSLNYEEFMEVMFILRTESSGIGFTDKSVLEKGFLKHYEKLIGNDKVSVTEYGSGVPILSLYLASKGKIHKIFCIENDRAVLQELGYVISNTKIPVEIIEQDLNKMDKFPDTDIGISINCLYGYSPTYIQGATGIPLEDLPIIKKDILKKSTHQRFGLFRFMNNYITWNEEKNAIDDMKKNFKNIESHKDEITSLIRGFNIYHGRSGYSQTQGNSYVILGRGRK